MSSPLRGAEIDACVHRIALSRAEPSYAVRTLTTPEMERRRHEAENHRRAVTETLKSVHRDAVVASGRENAAELLRDGVELILQPRVNDPSARRSTSVEAFVRVGRVGERFTYAPLVIKNHEVTEASATRYLLEGTLDRLLPSEIVRREGLGLRSTPTVRRDGLVLANATRVLEAFGAADPGTRGALVDRHGRLWWLELGAPTYPRFNLAAYDALYGERLAVLEALDEWFEVGGEFPTSPYWHRECLTCEFNEHCEAQLEAVDDVSLTRFTSIGQQEALRASGVRTRAQLARLDPVRAQHAKAHIAPSPESAREEFERVDRLSRSFDKLDELIYRARAHVRGSPLRILDPSQMGCPTADVEIDVDMESYDDATYLWGANVTVHRDVEGVTTGHYSFVTWELLTRDVEARIFAEFWSWFSDVRRRCLDQERSVAAYCFWAQAEDGAMNRAVQYPVDAGPTSRDLADFRAASPSQWIDLHALASRQIQTEGPLGLKQLAASAGFEWRDVNPSGEASMTWYEVASRDQEREAKISRQRILDYNEDDCRATKALRDWLNGPAKALAHRNDHF